MPNKLCRQHFMRVRCPHLNMRSLSAPELATHSDAPPPNGIAIMQQNRPWIDTWIQCRSYNDNDNEDATAETCLQHARVSHSGVVKRLVCSRPANKHPQTFALALSQLTDCEQSTAFTPDEYSLAAPDCMWTELALDAWSPYQAPDENQSWSRATVARL